MTMVRIGKMAKFLCLTGYISCSSFFPLFNTGLFLLLSSGDMKQIGGSWDLEWAAVCACRRDSIKRLDTGVLLTRLCGVERKGQIYTCGIYEEDTY